MRIGDALVDVPTREITMPQAKRPSRVTPKAMAVLCVLAGSPGQVVGRNDLLARVWPDTLPTDDVLTQAVTQLRKSFGADGKRYIETIAKSGYRLMAPVEPVPSIPAAPAPAAVAVPVEVAIGSTPGPASGRADADAEASPASPPGGRAGTLPAVRRRGRRRAPWALLAGGAVAVFTMGAVVAMLVTGDPPPAPTWAEGSAALADAGRPYRLITSTPGFEMSPSLSPDASTVAYSATVPGREGTVIQVQPTTVAQPRQLSRPPATASDSRPAWSPDGREIAFARRWADGRCLVMIAAANGAGPEREATGCDGSDLVSFSWTPDQRGLLFGSMDGDGSGHGMRILDLASGQWRALDYPSNGGIDHEPAYSPDGEWIAFVRNPQLGDLWRIPSRGGPAEQLTELGAEIRGWSWLPDSRSLVFSRRVDSGTRLYRLDAGSGEVYDLGLEDAQGPVVSAQTGALAFVHRRPRFGIHRIARAGVDDGPVVAERLFDSFGRDSQPIVSPDGNQIVFTSDRTGHFELWWAELSRPQSLRPIEGIRPDTLQPPTWSPDGQRVLVTGRGDSERQAVFELSPGSGQWTELPAPVERPLQALYLPDPTRLLVGAETQDGDARLLLFDRSGSPWRELRAIDDVSHARLDVHGERILFTRLSGDGLWEADLALSPDSVRRLDAEQPSRWRYRTWAVTGDGGVEYLRQSGDCQAQLVRLAAPGGVGRCLDAERLGSTNGFSVDPRTGDVFVALAVEDGTDIAFIPPLPSRPEPQRPLLSMLLKRLVNSAS